MAVRVLVKSANGGYCAAVEQVEEWPRRLAVHVGRRVAHFRERAGRMTAQALADRCAELGHPLDRSVIAKLEKGHRNTVTVADVLVLAKALGVSPALLIFPIGAEQAVEVLPGESQPTWDALRWFTGEAPYPGGDHSEWEASGPPTNLWRRHDRLVSEYMEILATASLVGISDLREPMGDIFRRLREVRGEIQRRGLTPPELPDELANILSPEWWTPDRLAEHHRAVNRAEFGDAIAPSGHIEGGERD